MKLLVHWHGRRWSVQAKANKSKRIQYTEKGIALPFNVWVEEEHRSHYLAKIPVIYYFEVFNLTFELVHERKKEKHRTEEKLLLKG